MFIKVIAESAEYWYSPKVDELPHMTPDGIKISHNFTSQTWRGILVPNMSDFRAVVSPYPIVSSTPALQVRPLQFLHWDDNLDLELLDKKVIGTLANDGDFINSIKVEFHPTVQCRHCNWEGIGLVVDTGDSYIGAYGLGREKLNRRYERGGLIETCPVCGEALGIGIVKIFPNNVNT